MDDEDTAWQIAIGGLSGDPHSQSTIPGLASITEGGAIDQDGKADDAIDFEDVELSDDELPDEEEPNTAPASNEVPGLTEGDTCTSNDTDDLFGDLQDSSLDLTYPHLRSSPHPLDADSDEARLTLTAGESIDDLRELNFNFDIDRSTANQDPNIPAPPESTYDLVKLQWPDFHKDAILNYSELFRSKPATWIPKKPTKPPKPLVPTKLTLEVDIDQEKQFRIPGTATMTVWQKIRDAESKGLVCLEEPDPIEPADLEIFNLDDESDTELVGGFTLRDFETLCDDWEGMVDLADKIQTRLSESGSGKRPIKDEDAAWEEMFLDAPASKRRKLEPPRGLPAIPTFTAPNFDNFEQATVKLGKRVILDMNDPYLLIDDKDSDRAAKRRKVQHKMVRMSNGKLGRELQQRFNYSNDVAYEALKENNSNRVRATIAAIPVEHSMPAIRLQWPYYKVKLSASDPHSYHRPQLQTRQQVSTVKFSKPNVQRRKALKGKKIKDIFRESKDLSMNDNSTAVLFEYCEEIPTVLSNFGMGSKIVNYFRRNKGSDSRPDKQELGENCILLPEDRSPFAIFGHVHPGETVPTFHTQMYRAPIFKHTPRGTDFLIGRSTTGLGGSTWYIRNIDHIYAVGQTLPSMEVPGPHSRRVTNIAKNRLKMVSYRLLRKHPHVTLSDITKHVADSNDSQNRQKLKEFLRFRKDTKDWALPEGEEPMDEEEIRSLVKPEEVCVLDAMQVGVHELENGGYQLAGDTLKDEDLDMMGDDIPADALAQKMVPWKTTKAFIDASYGKAMLAIHGPGDPTGRGLGISFLKTSMKGGFLEQLQGPLATSADAIERQKKANGGHMYNVKNQDQLYAEAITDIWNRQRQSLEDAQEHDDEDVQPQEDEDDRFNVKETAPTPAMAEGASQISRSAASALNRRKLHITRTIKRPDGKTEQVTEIVHDPAVIAQYVKRRRQQDVEEIDIYNYKLTGDNEKDRVILELVEKERERLEKNKERRHKREKQKKMLQGHGGGPSGGGGGGGGGGGEGSPEPTTEKVTGTTRKCANCGQIGHIKTNKKLCPLLNGTIQKDPNMEDGPGLGGSAPVAAHFFGQTG